MRYSWPLSFLFFIFVGIISPPVYVWGIYPRSISLSINSYYPQRLPRERLRYNDKLGVRDREPRSNLRSGKFLQIGGIVNALKGTDFNQVKGLVSSSLGALAPNSCAAEMINIGYTNKALDEDDYPFHPNCNRDASGMDSISCFPPSATVLTPSGYVRMDQLQIGTAVATHTTLGTNTSSLNYSPVLFFLHKDEYKHDTPWITLKWKINEGSGSFNEGALTLSPYHLVKFSPRSVVSYSDNPRPFHFAAARRLRVGDYLMVVPSCEKSVALRHTGCTASAVPARVIAVQMSYEGHPSLKGVYAPVTEAGVLLVNNVVTSQYSTLPYLSPRLDSLAHSVAHHFISPLLKILSFCQTALPLSVSVRAAYVIQRLLDQMRLSLQACFHVVLYGILAPVAKV